MRMILTLLGLSLAASTAALADGASPGPRSGVKAFRESDGPPAASDRRRGGVQPYQPTELTDEQREAANTRARYKMGTWRETQLPPPEPRFPWMPIGFTLLTFAVVAPFAWSSYRHHVGEIPDRRAFGGARRRSAPKDPTA
jgi:hypothetical protein